MGEFGMGKISDKPVAEPQSAQQEDDQVAATIPAEPIRDEEAFPVFMEWDVSPLERYCRTRFVQTTDIPKNSPLQPFPGSGGDEELSVMFLTSAWLWPEFHRRRATPFASLVPASPLMRSVQEAFLMAFDVDNEFMTGYVSHFITVAVTSLRGGVRVDGGSGRRRCVDGRRGRGVAASSRQSSRRPRPSSRTDFAVPTSLLLVQWRRSWRRRCRFRQSMATYNANKIFGELYFD
ncbi:MAG: hypothetical protein U5N85_20435 [Arcicella sp.]|nr:hypothetical protein [Arcicella sp.]